MIPRSTLNKRATDSPYKLSALFVLFYIVLAPWYAITRRDWSVLLKTLLALIAQSLVSELITHVVKISWGVSISENPFFLVLDFLIATIVIAITSYYSIKGVVSHARLQLSGISGGECDAKDSEVRSLKSRISQVPLYVKNKIPKRYLRKRVLLLFFAVLLCFPLVSYGIYSIAVEKTVMSNPILAAVARTGTKVKIRHFNCGDLYGTYDTGTDTMDICLSAHGSDFASSKETTIRHEAWHLVQACSTLKTKDDEWGNIALVNPPDLVDQILPDEDTNFIDEYYTASDRPTEREAFLAERFLTDAKIIDSIDKYCYFPD